MKKNILYIVSGLLMLSSCSMDINDDPNYPTEGDMTASLVFPAVENAVATATGDQMFNYGGFFAQYWEQAPTANQYNDLAELNINEGSQLFDRCYRTIYAGALTDIKEILKRDDINSSDRFACTVMRALAFQLVVDNLSDAPYTEALQGSANSQPHWDGGQAVYEGVLAELDAAEAELSTGQNLSMTDPLLSKNINKWIGFANALRLRMYLRMIDGNINAAEYTSKVKALVAANNFFTGDVAWDVYSDAQGQFNPWADSFYGSAAIAGTKNLCAAYPIISYQSATADPRISYGYAPRAKDDTYVGQLPGSKTLTGDWLGISSGYNEDYVSMLDYSRSKSMPIYLFTQSELQFLIAEVELRFNNNDAAAKAAYEAGVEADFASKGCTGLMTFLNGSKVNWDGQASATGKLNLIYMQKWVALFYRDHMEAWSEIRRTDVPALSSATAKEIFNSPTGYNAGDMIEPGVNHINAGGLAKRVPYPSSARQLNSNTPAEKLLSDRVFWDAK